MKNPAFLLHLSSGRVRTVEDESKRMPGNRKVFAFTGLIRCGGCDGAVTAEEKHQVICSECRFKFAYRSKENCPRCKLPIGKMTNPRRLAYTYYHCANSYNPTFCEKSVTLEELKGQIGHILTEVRLPTLYDLWLNRSMRRMRGSRDDLEALSGIRALFPGTTPEIQRQIAITIFSDLVLKDRKLSVTLKAPFVLLTESDVTRAQSRDRIVCSPAV
jgi:hypothetical protein